MCVYVCVCVCACMCVCVCVCVIVFEWGGVVRDCNVSGNCDCQG
jgi:hypothetical protein